MREGLGTRLEPDNPVDKNEKWAAFGYIVHELIDDVPKAMKDSHVEVSFIGCGHIIHSLVSMLL